LEERHIEPEEPPKREVKQEERGHERPPEPLEPPRNHRDHQDKKKKRRSQAKREVEANTRGTTVRTRILSEKATDDFLKNIFDMRDPSLKGSHAGSEDLYHLYPLCRERKKNGRGRLSTARMVGRGERRRGFPLV
jgi:hypothetical protein